MVRFFLILFAALSLPLYGVAFSPDIPEQVILVSDVGEEISSFRSAKPGDGSFLVFLTGHAGNDGASSFAQVSVEGGEIGIDHVLNTEAHNRLETKFRQFAESRGYSVLVRNTNGVSYLRILVPDIGSAIIEVLIHVHGLQPRSETMVFGELEDAT